jgi:hypothetical protein
MQLKQIVLGIGERGDAAVRAHVAARKMPPAEPLDSQRDHSNIDRVEYDHAAARLWLLRMASSAQTRPARP